MSNLNTKTFTFAGTALEGIVEIASVTLRQLTGEDELAVAERIGTGDPTGARVLNQLIAESIVKVDGESVTCPYVGWKAWDLPTIGVVRACFDRYQYVQEKDMKDFLDYSFGVTRKEEPKPD